MSFLFDAAEALGHSFGQSFAGSSSFTGARSQKEGFRLRRASDAHPSQIRLPSSVHGGSSSMLPGGPPSFVSSAAGLDLIDEAQAGALIGKAPKAQTRTRQVGSSGPMPRMRLAQG